MTTLRFLPKSSLDTKWTNGAERPKRAVSILDCECQGCKNAHESSHPDDMVDYYLSHQNYTAGEVPPEGLRKQMKDDTQLTHMIMWVGALTGFARSFEVLIKSAPMETMSHVSGALEMLQHVVEGRGGDDPLAKLLKDTQARVSKAVKDIES